MLLGFAQSKLILWIGLILFSIGENNLRKIIFMSDLKIILASSIVINVINSFGSKYGLESEFP